MFKVDLKEEVLFVQTPISGTMQYFYDTDDVKPGSDKLGQGDWLNVRDAHDMRGLITRYVYV